MAQTASPLPRRSHPNTGPAPDPHPRARAATAAEGRA